MRTEPQTLLQRTSHGTLLLPCLIAGACAGQEYVPGERHASQAMPAPETAQLVTGTKRLNAGHPAEQSGFYLLHDGLSAFAARMALISLAESSLDLQYYIFAEDTSSRILVSALLEAADRGVRVRLLLDDLGTRVETPSATALDEHPNVEIRIFNPVAARGGIRRLVQQAVAFGRVNHRMHNKLMVADGAVMITGGRNIADEYFSNSGVDFQDLDVMAAGAVLSDAGRSFDDYWNSEGAVPLSLLLPRRSKTPSLAELRTQAPEILAASSATEFARALRESTIARDLQNGELPLHWGIATLYADPPEKALSHDALSQDAYLGHALREITSGVRERLTVTSAYFVPGRSGVQLLDNMVDRGIDVRILTNSLATTDVAIVHSGYGRYRKPLLEAGVDLWELKTSAGQQQRMNWFKGESRASLHAKAMLIDADAAFIGSVNLDARSLVQNTEIGLLIESPSVNRQVDEIFADWFSDAFAWHLTLEEGELRWHSSNDGQPVTVTHEPQTSGWQRFKVWLLSWLPVESQI